MGSREADSSNSYDWNAYTRGSANYTTWNSGQQTTDNQYASDVSWQDWGNSNSSVANGLHKWNDPVPSNQKLDDPWEASVSSMSGLYIDCWSAACYVVKVEGNMVFVSEDGGSWSDRGQLTGNTFEVSGLSGTFGDNEIKFDNGASWTKDTKSAAQGSVPTEQRSQPASTFVNGMATESADSWAQAQPSSQEAWSNWGTNQQEFEGTGESDRGKLRKLEFDRWQEYYKEQGTLPRKSQAEIEEDEKVLFSNQAASCEGEDFALYDEVQCAFSGPKSENIPRLVTFDQMFEEFQEFIPNELVANVRRCGYKRPTPVQKFAIPAAIIGRDVMCCAQTGSGKTAAFLIPILAGMMKHAKSVGKLNEPFSGPCAPDTLCLSPTRELCLQIYREALKFCHGTPFRCVRVYGAEKPSLQIKEIALGADLCIATPGRLWDFVDAGTIDLSQANCLVLDEADRMLSMNMELHIRNVVENYGFPKKEERQTMMFSATFPEECQKLAADYLYEHVFLGVGVIGGAVNTVKQTLVKVSPENKFDNLIEFLYEFLENRQDDERALVFTNSKAQAKGLDEQLWAKKFDTGALHGDLTQDQREDNLQKFREGKIDVLVATDLASRGLDIRGVSHVVNYDLPWEKEIYVQRIGRTGRIGHRGHAITYIAVDKQGKFQDKSDVLQSLPEIMLNAGDNEVPEWLADQIKIIQANSWLPRENTSLEAARTDARWGGDSWQKVPSDATTGAKNVGEADNKSWQASFNNWQ